MKKAIAVCLILALALAGFVGCTQAAPTVAPAATVQGTATPAATAAPTPAPAVERPARFTIDSKALAQNLTGENPQRTSYILVPASYNTGDRAYPVVYFINGFSNTPGSFVLSQKISLDKAMPQGQEFIVVDVDMHNAAGGSFGVNSPVTGNWEDYLIKEVIPYVDAHYRTIPQASARGICGFSMGGFITLNLGLKHPDTFCAAYALSPGLFDPNGLADAMDLWDPGFKTAYGQAFSPLPADQENKYRAVPAMDGSEADKTIVANWESGFGDLQKKIDAYLALKTPLKAIGIEYGIHDGYPWIPKGCVYFAGLLDAAKIPYAMKTFPGDHSIPSAFTKDSVVPFFTAAFGK